MNQNGQMGPVRNVALLRRLAATLREDPARYSPDTYGERTGDGTIVACFAGWTMILVHGEDACFDKVGRLWAPVPEGQSGSSVDGQAAEALGLTREEESVMSNTRWRPGPSLTPADVIDLLADGAAVAAVTDWSLFDRENSPVGRNLRAVAAHS